MIGRRQLVQVWTDKSNKESVPFGVPQRGGLPPLLFIIFTSDMEGACTEAMTLTYADDTSASVIGKYPEEVCAKLEATSLEVMDYMAANGMAPNEKKDEFMVYQKEKSRNIKVGNSEVQEAKEVRLLGGIPNKDMNWSGHVCQVELDMRRRTRVIRRLSYHLPQHTVLGQMDALVISKARYHYEGCCCASCS
jgi:hypothetical protein